MAVPWAIRSAWRHRHRPWRTGPVISWWVGRSGRRKTRARRPRRSWQSCAAEPCADTLNDRAVAERTCGSHAGDPLRVTRRAGVSTALLSWIRLLHPVEGHCQIGQSFPPGRSIIAIIMRLYPDPNAGFGLEVDIHGKHASRDRERPDRRGEQYCATHQSALAVYLMITVLIAYGVFRRQG